MSGCYRCGLPEGSESRLCETCYRGRFHRGLLVVDRPGPTGEGALELSPRAQTIVLGGGALAYIGIICFVVRCFGHFSGLSAETASHEFYSPPSAQTAIIRSEQSLPSIAVPRLEGKDVRAALGEGVRRS